MKQTSIDWLIEQFWNNEGMLTSKKLEQAREMYQDEIEAAAIISSAEQSTSAASALTEAFAIGYDQGYKRALDLVEWKINNELKNVK